MGLDTVELVLEFEDEFDIRISDELAARMVTVGDTSLGIVELLKQKESTAGVCSTARSFYRLRREVMERYGVKRNSVKLDTPIGMLVPAERDRDWPRIAEAAGLRGEAYRIFRKMSPPGEMSVRELICSRCKTSWRTSDGGIDEEAVFRHVREIVSEQLGAPMDRIGWETKYIEDLGAD